MTNNYSKDKKDINLHIILLNLKKRRKKQSNLVLFLFCSLVIISK